MYNFRINTISDPLISKCNPVVVCKFCGRPGHTKRSCSAINKGTEEDEIFFSQVVSVKVGPHIQETADAEVEPEQVAEEEAEVWVLILTQLHFLSINETR